MNSFCCDWGSIIFAWRNFMFFDPIIYEWKYWSCCYADWYHVAKANTIYSKRELLFTWSFVSKLNTPNENSVLNLSYWWNNDRTNRPTSFLSTQDKKFPCIRFEYRDFFLIFGPFSVKMLYSLTAQFDSTPTFTPTRILYPLAASPS